MRKLIIALFSLVSIAPVLRADAQTSAGVYVEPSVLYSMSSREYDAAAGGALAIGVCFDRKHDVGIEVIMFKAKSKNGISAGWPGYCEEVTMIPLLTSYRYAFSAGKKFRFFIGVETGVTFEKSDLTPRSQPNDNYGNYSRKYSDRYLSAIYGGQFGAAYELTEHTALTLGAKIFEIGGTSRGPFKTLQLGLRYSF